MTSAQRSRIMRAVRARDTGPERALRRLLCAIGRRGYRLHRRDLPGAPDVAYIGRRKAIFMHGCFWHGHDCKRGARAPRTNSAYWSAKIDRNRRRDRANVAALKARGWEVCVIWECEMRDPEGVSRRLAAFLQEAADPASAENADRRD